MIGSEKENEYAKAADSADSEGSISTPRGDNSETIAPSTEGISLPFINDFLGPVVLFFGPRNVGKTVALMRLLHYIENFEDCSYGFTTIRSDNGYSNTKEDFLKVMSNLRRQPPRTGNFDFLMLNITQNGQPVCNILESPGEHFFDINSPEDMGYPNYLNQIFRSPNKKIFVVFISEYMFDDHSLREQYAMKIDRLINREIQPKRDKIVFLFNKIDEHPELFQGGKVNQDAVRDKIFALPSYNRMISAVRKNRAFKEVIFVPFYSGNFDDGNKAWNMSEDYYPKQLWGAILRQLRGKWRLF